MLVRAEPFGQLDPRTPRVGHERDAEIERVREQFAADTLPQTRWFQWREANPPPERSREESAERS